MTEQPAPPERRRGLSTSRRLNLVHRVGAVVLGAGLAVFGVLGLVNRLEPFTTAGVPILGLSSNGLLSILSLVVAVVLVGAALVSGPTASAVLTVIGAAFLLSGVLNALVLNTALNLLAFRMPNVIFSLVAGLFLLTVGAWGRFTGRLPDDNPYQQYRHPDQEPGQVLPAEIRDPDQAAAAAELADAERARAQGAGTPGQVRGAAAADQARSDEDRLDAWRRTHEATGDRHRRPE